MGCITAKAWREGGISAGCSRIGGITAGCHRVGAIFASCSVVCETNITLYLRVSPQEVQWITDSTGVNYEVFSNTSWNVE